MRILIMGGYGVFGGRLARLLKDDPRLTLVIAGRSQQKAEAFCAELSGSARLEPRRIDRNGDLELAIRSADVGIVVDATGPFQNYGDRPYRLIEACLQCGVNYLDLADGSPFVEGVSAFDTEARARGLFVLSGVSSFPVLTAAVARSLSADFERVKSIVGGIAPSPYAGVGRNVIEAISSYAGQPLTVRRDGKDALAHALVETRRRTIAAPGRTPLANTLFSLVDVPDLHVVPQRWPDVQTVWMGAGPVPEVLHRALRLLAIAVKHGLLSSLSPFAGLFTWAVNHVRWGEHRGGMFVDVEGEIAGRAVRRSWHMLAESDDGPLIPSMACAAVIRRILSGRAPPAGARAADAELELRDYENVFSGYRITTGCWREAASGESLYQRVLGEAYDQLPAEIQALHGSASDRTYVGRARVDRGRNPAARLVASVFGFPTSADDVPLQVQLTSRDGRETWTRRFGTRAFSSLQEAGVRRDEHLLVERFGAFAFGMALVVEGERLRLVVRRWRFLGLPMPKALAPGGDAWESEIGGRFNFYVDIRAPVIGRIVRYQGWLEPLLVG